MLHRKIGLCISVEDIKRDIKLESRKNYPFLKNNEQKENLNIKGSRGLAT
jgi:hypothetical protein